MKRFEHEISAHQAEISKLNRMLAWNKKEAERFKAQAERKSINGGATAGYLFMKADFHADETEVLQKKLEKVKYDYDHPGVLARIKRFLFNK